MHQRFLIAGIVLVCLSAWIIWLGIPIQSALIALLWLAGVALWLYGYGSMLIKPSPSANFSSHTKLILAAVALAIFTPPILSKDVYIYLLQGKLALQGITTYTDGSLNLAHHWVEHVDPQWRDCPNHYGTVAMSVFCIAATANSLNLAIVLLKILFLGMVWAAYHLLCAVAKSLQLGVSDTNQAICAFLLNPVLLLQGLGQLHIDLISSLLVLLFMYGLTTQKRWWLAPISIGLLGATKFLLFPVFLGIYLVFQAYQWRQNQSKVQEAFAGFVLAMITLILLYAPIWQGPETITHPMAYHNEKEPVKSVVELLSYVAAYIQPSNNHHASGPDPLLAQKIAAGKLLAPYFKLLAILLAGWIVWNTLRIPERKHILLQLGSLVLLIFILYSPVMHPWYFLFVLPFFAFFSHERHIWLYLVITFGLCNVYELGPLLQKPWGPILTIGGTIVSVLSYFVGINRVLER